MKKDKRLQKLIAKLVEVSFKDGSIVESNVTSSVKTLKSLPKNESIAALTEYLKGIKRKMREHTMYIETTIPLSSTELKKMKKVVEKTSLPTGKQVRITKVVSKINPDILGGFRLRVGDEVWDESMTGKINQLKEVIRG